MPISVRIPSIIDIKNMYPHVIKSIFLRSKISDNAPDGKANRKIGSGLAVVIRETNNGFGAMEVISHDAPTSYIAEPIYEKRTANHNVLYRPSLKGFKPDGKFFSSFPDGPISAIINNHPP